MSDIVTSLDNVFSANIPIVPDFRTAKTGLFATLRTQHKLKASGKHLFDASVYRNDSSTSSFHDMVRELSHLTQQAKPTPFHHMLATLAEEGRLLRLYSQNIDGIDTALEPLSTTVPLNKKGPWPKTIQLHGGLEKMVCSKCGHLADFDGKLFEGPEPPPCQECETIDLVRQASGLRSHGIGRLRPRMVLYNEFNPDEEAIGAVSTADLKARPDAVIVVGTSLKVPGIRRLAKEMCSVSRGKRGGFTAWINFDPEPVGIDLKDCWDMVVRGECDEVARLVSLPNWDDKDVGEFTVLKDAESETKISRPEVVVKTELVAGLQTTGIPTPMDSPQRQSPTPLGPSKLKQIPLSFASRTALPSTPTKPPPKKRGRKPLPSGPTKRLPNIITNAFTSSKASVPIESKVSKVEFEHVGYPVASSSTTASSPILSKDFASSPMRPVSPFESRNNSKLPETPKMPFVEVTAYDRETTISPKSMPSGMAHLLS